jgi:hypothetical protein
LGLHSLRSGGDIDASSIGTVDWTLTTAKIVIFGDLPMNLRLNVHFLHIRYTWT